MTPAPHKTYGHHAGTNVNLAGAVPKRGIDLGRSLSGRRKQNWSLCTRSRPCASLVIALAARVRGHGVILPYQAAAVLPIARDGLGGLCRIRRGRAVPWRMAPVASAVAAYISALMLIRLPIRR